MTTKRKPLNRGRKPPTTFSPRAIALFKLAREIQQQPGAVEKWEAEGGRRREYLNTGFILNYEELGRHPGDEHVLDTLGHDEPPEWMIKRQPSQLESWWSAHALGLALQKAADA